MYLFHSFKRVGDSYNEVTSSDIYKSGSFIWSGESHSSSGMDLYSSAFSILNYADPCIIQNFHQKHFYVFQPT